jgi:hypothetical protein
MTVVGILMKFVFRLYAAHANLGGKLSEWFQDQLDQKRLTLQHQSQVLRPQPKLAPRIQLVTASKWHLLSQSTSTNFAEDPKLIH